jgi:hypothetical protein
MFGAIAVSDAGDIADFDDCADGDGLRCRFRPRSDGAGILVPILR